MKKIKHVFFVSIVTLLSVGNIFSGQKLTKEDNSQITLEDFQVYKNYFQENSDLRRFIDDFEKWPKEDRKKIKINGLSFMISEEILSAKKYENGNLGYWIDYRTQTQKSRRALIESIKYLQNQG